MPPSRFIAPEELEKVAAAFLERHHPSLSKPVPIEKIVEFDLRLGILPLANLERDFGVDGFLTLQPDTIVVDERQMLRQLERYRFTLAHEVGHWLLHRDLYDLEGVTDLESYLAVHEALDETMVDSYEFQARNLGGRILLPRDTFLTVGSDTLPGLRKRLPAGASPQLLCKGLAKLIAPLFQVHERVAETRLVGDGLCEELGLPRPEK